MSVEASKWAWEQSGGSAAINLVLLCLADHADEIGENCWPGQKRIAKKTKLSIETISRAVKFLETVPAVDKSGLVTLGVIEITKIPIPDMGAVSRNSYKLLLDRLIKNQPDQTSGGVGNSTNSRVRLTESQTVLDGKSNGAVDLKSSNPSSEELSDELKIKSAIDSESGEKAPHPVGSEKPDGAKLIGAELWEKFKSFRIEQGRGLGIFGAEMVALRLARIASSGGDPVAAVEAAMRNGWKEIYRVNEVGEQIPDDGFSDAELSDRIRRRAAGENI